MEILGADTYFVGHIHSSTWAQATTEQKQAALDTAERDVRSVRGVKPERNYSAFLFAVYEQAISLLDPSLSHRQNLRSQGVVSISLGHGVSETYIRGSANDLPLAPRAKAYLQKCIVRGAKII